MLLESSKLWKNSKVLLTPLTIGDVTDEYVSWLNSPQVNRYLECRFTTHTIESTQRFVQNCLDDSATIFLAIRCISLSNRHVGNIKVGPIDRNHKTAEVGIMIGGQDAWGKGIGTAAIQIVTDIAKDDLSLRRLTAGCYKSNVGSWRAFTNAGFVIEAERPEHFLLDGLPESLLLMGCNLDK